MARREAEVVCKVGREGSVPAVSSAATINFECVLLINTRYIVKTSPTTAASVVVPAVSTNWLHV